jgi:D-xylose 1-dehydrogenase (NADP+, D-xylono-1,5-lactone-forming)
MGKVRWGVLSTASIGRLVIEATAQARATEFVAVASRDAARARAFADELGLGLSFGSYEELLASEAVDAVYVALPVSMHAEWTVRSLEAGKHVLCEKPLALRAEDAERCFAAAAAAGRLCAEGLMWRHHPRTAVARRLFAGEPERVWAEQVPDGPGGVDLRLAATLRMPDDVLAQFGVGLDLPRRDELELVGTEGKLTLPDPWLCRPDHLELERDGDLERLPADPDGTFGLTDPDHDVYRIELDTVSAAIAAGDELPFSGPDAVAQADKDGANRGSGRARGLPPVVTGGGGRRRPGSWCRPGR